MAQHELGTDISQRPLQTARKPFLLSPSATSLPKLVGFSLDHVSLDGDGSSCASTDSSSCNQSQCGHCWLYGFHLPCFVLVYCFNERAGLRRCDMHTTIAVLCCYHRLLRASTHTRSGYNSVAVVGISNCGPIMSISSLQTRADMSVVEWK